MASKCAPYIQTVEELDLTPHGFPGMTFSGELSIEADDTNENEDWYIEAVHATNADGKTYTTFSPRSKSAVYREIFFAVRKAVFSDGHLCDIILETSREHAA